MHKFELERYMFICKEKKYVFADFTNPQIKKIGPQIANPQSATFAEVCKYSNLFKFANLWVCDLPTALLWK